MIYKYSLIFAICAFGAAGSSLGAQSRSTNDANQLRNDCRLAEQVIETGNPAPHTDWAYSRIVFCGTEAAPALASAWIRPTSEPQLAAREEASASLADTRILAAVVRVSSDPSRSKAERISAFSTLVKLLLPGRSINESFWNNPQNSALGVYGHVHLTVGTQPITASDRAATLQALDRLAASSTDAQAALVAKRLRPLLQ